MDGWKEGGESEEFSVEFFIFILSALHGFCGFVAFFDAGWRVWMYHWGQEGGGEGERGMGKGVGGF